MMTFEIVWFPLKVNHHTFFNITWRKGNFCNCRKVKRVELDISASPQPLFTLLGLCGICCMSAVGGSAGKASRGKPSHQPGFNLFFFFFSLTVCMVPMSIILFKTTSPSSPFRTETVLVCSRAVLHLLADNLKTTLLALSEEKWLSVSALQCGTVMFELI